MWILYCKYSNVSWYENRILESSKVTDPAQPFSALQAKSIENMIGLFFYCFEKKNATGKEQDSEYKHSLTAEGGGAVFM